MKKKLFAVLMLSMFSMSTMNAEISSIGFSEKTLSRCWYSTSYSTETVGNCTVTYKIVTKYCFCYPICKKKCEIKRDCSDHGPGKNNR
nr:hypothetical protein [uncultured Chryseobacterium sp.]